MLNRGMNTDHPPVMTRDEIAGECSGNTPPFRGLVKIFKRTTLRRHDNHVSREA